ncbi:Octopamine receptor 2 [Schistosoma japonicum]|uniref:Octopamine receptor 2 n=1 Tax=Schistosoma japonicum TaxID=6182 RepID=A0A4Z2DHE8_SCHJA|nr:Octopamine receptor 2 [Schistosoma japonicum]
MKISVTYSNSAFVIISIIFLCIILLTVIGNALVFAALFRFKKLRSTSNLLIGNLALSDLLLAITVLPFSATTDATGVWLFGPMMCDVWLTIDVFYCTASVWGLVTIAFDRFTATTFPIWYRGNQNRRRVICYMLFVWILSGLICLPGLLGWGSKEFDKNRNNASIIITYLSPGIFQNLNESKQKKQAFPSTSTHVYNPALEYYECVLFTESHYIVYSAMGSFIIPFIIMIILYAKIFFILQQRTRLIRQSRRIHKPSQCVIFHDTMDQQSVDKMNINDERNISTSNVSTSIITVTTMNPIITNIKIAVDAPSRNSLIYEKDSKVNETIQHSFSSTYGSPSASSTNSYCCCCCPCTCTCSCYQCGRGCHYFQSSTTNNTNTDSTTDWNSQLVHNSHDPHITATTNVGKLIHADTTTMNTVSDINKMNSLDETIHQTTIKVMANPTTYNNNYSVPFSIITQSPKISLSSPSATASSTSHLSALKISNHNIKLETALLHFNHMTKDKISHTSKESMCINSPSPKNQYYNYLSVDQQKYYPISPFEGLGISSKLDNHVNGKDKQQYNGDFQKSSSVTKQDNYDEINENVNTEIQNHSNEIIKLNLETNQTNLLVNNAGDNCSVNHRIHDEQIGDTIHVHNLCISAPFATILKKFPLLNYKKQKKHDYNIEATSITHKSNYQPLSNQLSIGRSLDLEQHAEIKQIDTIYSDEKHEKDEKGAGITSISGLSSSSSIKRHQKQKHHINQLKQLHNQKRIQQQDQVIERVEQRERRATKRMGLIIIIFALSWIPFTLMYLVRGLCGEQHCPDIPDLRKFVTWLGYVNSTINPILYALFNVHFRQAFIYFLKCTRNNSYEKQQYHQSPQYLQRHQNQLNLLHNLNNNKSNCHNYEDDNIHDKSIVISKRISNLDISHSSIH